MSDAPASPAVSAPATASTPPAASTPAPAPAETPNAPAAAEEAPPPAPSPEPAKERERHNPRTREFAALTRKEREVRQRIAQLQQLEPRVSAYERARQLARENPDEYLKAGELSYDDVTKFYSTGYKPDPDAKLKAVDERVRKTEALLQQREQELQQERSQRAIQQFVANIEKVVQSETQFELIRAENATDQVYELIDLHYRKTGDLMDIKEAAEQIEATLEEVSLERAKKLMALKKIQRKLQPESSDSSKLPTSPPAAGKTLTSELTASSSQPSGKPQTPDERWERILARARSS